MDLFIIFVAGMAVGNIATVLTLSWAQRQLYQIMTQQLTDEGSADGNKIELEIELDGKIFLCYNKATKEFVCQGTSVEEIQQHFASRFPNSAGVIVGGPKQVLDVIKQQLKDTQNESSSSLGSTP